MRASRFLSVTLVACMPALGASAAELAWPAVTHETKPWSRWWWLGSISTEEGLRAAMEQYAAAGLGGLEITPIYGVRGYEDQFISYLTPEWMNRLGFVLKEAQRLDLGIDMATGNGWPFGGPWVGAADACRYLAYTNYTVPAGGRLDVPVTYPEQTVLRFAGPTRVAIEQIRDPVATNSNLQELALDQVRFPKSLPLHALMAFPELVGGVGLPAVASAKAGDPGPASPRPATVTGIDLTSRVSADGTLDWTAPAEGGEWTLHALFAGWHGKLVERAGPGGEGNVIDHFDRAALRNYLKKFDEAFAGRDIRSLRGFFNDSYEVDDADGEANFTPRFFDEFQRHRGYDLRQHLPALIAGLRAPPVEGGRGAGGGAVRAREMAPRQAPAPLPDEQVRVLTDFRETISDLLLAEFTIPWQEWAGAKGAIIRNQAHGSPANILDLYAASDIPEQEGGDPIRLKFASSAAHVTGKRLASSETATWLTEHFVTTLADIKLRVDTTFLGGINHICYHGTAYSPPDDPWPGFQFYASVEANPSNSWWDHFGALNRYVTRVQSFLQAGQPAESVLLYYPIHDLWAASGGRSPHFSGPQGTCAAAAQAMWDAGITFDYVSDLMLEGVRMEDGALRGGKVAYDVVLVPGARLMPVSTMQHLFELARGGATIVFTGGVPADVPGLGNLEARRAQTRELTEALQDREPGPPGLADLPWGKGRLVVGDDVVKALEWVGVRPEPFPALGLHFARRRHEHGLTYFLVNQSPQRFDQSVRLMHHGRHAAWFDPMTGEFGVLPEVALPDGGQLVHLQLEAGQSCILFTSDEELAGPSSGHEMRAGTPSTLSGEWRVEFIKGGPDLPATVGTTELKSWTEFGGDAVKAFSGVARYTLNFPRPEGVTGVSRLDLGRVAESARVRLNGADLDIVFTPPYQVRIPAGLLRDQNTLEIEVANLMANRIADLDRRGVAWKKFYNTNMPARVGANRGPDGNFSAAAWEPRASGLLGPVTIVPLAWEQ